MCQNNLLLIGYLSVETTDTARLCVRQSQTGVCLKVTSCTENRPLLKS